MKYDTSGTRLDSYLEAAEAQLGLEKLKLCRRHLGAIKGDT